MVTSSFVQSPDLGPGPQMLSAQDKEQGDHSPCCALSPAWPVLTDPAQASFPDFSQDLTYLGRRQTAATSPEEMLNGAYRLGLSDLGAIFSYCWG